MRRQPPGFDDWLLEEADWKNQERIRILSNPLPQTAPDDLVSASQTPCIRQTIGFFELPAEIRNRIYELAMPSKEHGDVLLVASPAWDDQMSSAVQPGITRASKQTREESLKMFYANNELRAYVEYLDFRELVRWARCMSSPLKLRVHVFMLHKMSCFRGLLPFAQAWRGIPGHDRLHLWIHSDFGAPGRSQCETVVQAIKSAESSDSETTLNVRLQTESGLRCRCTVSDIQDQLNLLRKVSNCSKVRWVEY